MMTFVDFAQIEVQAGAGGDGHISFRHEKYVPKGGPDGGNGGHGADVLVVADENMSTLLDFRYKKVFRADSGGRGGKKDRSGQDGDNLIIKLPAGTIVKDMETGEVLADLKPGEPPVVVARGGKGGKGNAAFKSSVNQTPRTSTPGEQGQRRILELELKLLADVGLVGFPNAGKSTLLARISDARPKIADYPFTTLVPNLGIVKTVDFNSFVVADIPGIIEGAHNGRGLGLDFLRHVQRTRVLVFLIECTNENPEMQLNMLRAELGLFDPGLLDKPSLVALNKIDLFDSPARNIFDSMPKDWFKISAATGENINALVKAIEEILFGK
jgi:GTP-binding protein